VFPHLSLPVELWSGAQIQDTLDMHPVVSSGCSDFPDMYDEAAARLIFGSYLSNNLYFDSSPRHDVAESYSLLLHCCPRIYLSRNGLLLVLALFAEDAGTADLRYVPSAAHFSPSCR
jgi:hypothetical protein